MQVVTIDGSGKEAQLKISQAPDPIVQKNEVLIKVVACGLNHADLFQRQGLYPPPAGTPNIPGLEVSGQIIALGSAISHTYLHANVCALLSGGGYASLVNVAIEQVLPLPKGFTLEEAASLPEACATVWFNLFMKAKLKQGETVLVHGGSSGIGSMAIQLCHALGITCYTTAGSAKKCEWAEQLGAVKAINYKQEDFVERIMNMTHHKGVDVILDMVGGEYIQKNLKLLARNGRLVNIAFLQGAKVTANMANLVFKNISWMGTTLRDQPISVKKKIITQLHQHVWPLIEQGQVTPVIDRVFALNEANEAHEYMEKGTHMGKILLRL